MLRLGCWEAGSIPQLSVAHLK